MTHLVIAAFWTEINPDDSVKAVADAVETLALKGSGAVVSVKGVDMPLRRWLRQVQLDEPAAYRHDVEPCGRLLVGLGDDTYDPECVLPTGHGGPCQIDAPPTSRDQQAREETA